MDKYIVKNNCYFFFRKMITFVLFKPRLPRMRSSRRGGAKLLLPLRCKLQGIAPVCCKPVEGINASPSVSVCKLIR